MTELSDIYRLATVEDAERVLHITYEAYVTIRELGLTWPAAHADLALIEDNITHNKCYVLEQDGLIVATVTLADPERVKELTAETGLPFIMWFAVDPNVQGTGAGSKLLQWVEEHIIRDEVGAPAVTLGTAEKHPWLLPMYERRGYESIRSRDAGKGEGPMHLMRKVVHPERFEAYIAERKQAEQLEQTSSNGN